MTGIDTLALIVVVLLLLGAAALAFGHDTRDSMDEVRQPLPPLA